MINVSFNKSLGWEVPTGTFPCWVISDEDRFKSIKENKPFYDYSPSCYFKVLNKLDNNFLEGLLGHSSYKGSFHNDIHNTYTYFEDYLNRKPVYLSFDRVTLYKLITIHPTQPLTFILKRIDSPSVLKPNTAFMIMPFKYEELNVLYQNHIREFLLKELQIQIFRADDFNDNDVIIETIYNQIEQSEFIIADTSYQNKNVFFEFGYAAAKDKEIITIQNNKVEQSLFFDRAHIRAIFYSPDNMSEFQKQLKNTIIGVREKIRSKNQ